MARLVSLFINSDENPQQFAASMESILGLPLMVHPDPDKGIRLYLYTDNKTIRFSVCKNRLLNDRDLNFEDYRYAIYFGAINTKSSVDEELTVARFAEEIYDKVCASNSYEIMMVEDVDKKLAAFVPKG